MAGTPNTILIEPANGQRRIEEKLAGGAITPGHLVEVTSTNTFVVHNSAAANAQALFAIENLAAAEGIADAYVSGETTRALYAQPGDLIYALVAASATAITDGAFLESAGDGTLRILTTAAATPDTARNSVVAVAEEAVDNSGGGAAVRIQVRAV